MRKRKLLEVLAGPAVVVAAGVMVLWPPDDRITEQNFDRIAQGMSRADVEAILGAPRDRTTGPVTNAPGLQRLGLEVRVTFESDAVWACDSAWLEVEYKNSKLPYVWRIRRGRWQRVPQTWSENIVWRAKRQWHRWFPE